MNKKYGVKTYSSNNELSIHSHLFDFSDKKDIGNFRERTNKVLSLYNSGEEDRKIICIDGSSFSKNICLLDTEEKLLNTPSFLESGIDGVISNVKSKYEILLPVADCAAVAIYNNKTNVNGLVHAGYKGVGNGILENMVKKLSFLGDKQDFMFYFSPMAGNDFELPKDYTIEILNNIFKQYDLNKDNYLIKNPENKEKIFLDLKKLIKDILMKSGFKNGQLESGSLSITNNPKSIYPSYRLHTIAKGILEKIEKKCFSLTDDKFYGLDKEELTKQEIDLINSGKMSKYIKDYRLVMSLKNFTKK